MEIIICEDVTAGASLCSEIIMKQIKKKKNSVLGLATGATMVPLYKNLTKIYKDKKINFSKVKTFNLDEYFGLDGSEKESFRKFMYDSLFKKTNIKEQNINLLNGKTSNWKKECNDYEHKIKRAGGIDIQILGIGTNGHIAFNEPGSSINSKTRLVKLTSQTIRDNKKYFKNKKMPEYALSMGIKTILSSKKVILLAFGENKSKIIKKFLESKPTKNIPATFLKSHDDLTVILDKKAAKLIT